MKEKTKSFIQGEQGAILILVLGLFLNMAIASSKYMFLVYAIFGGALAYTAFLIIRNPKIVKEIITSCSFWWIVIFAIIMFVYGFFGANQEAYSLKFHLFNIFWLFIFLVILQDNRSNILNVIAKSSSIVIVLLSIYIVILNPSRAISVFTGKEFKPMGYTSVGNQNTTAISYIFLLLPLVYKMLVEKNKKYIPVTVIGIVFLILTGSKKSIIALILMIIIVELGKTKTKKQLINNIVIILLLIGILVAICYFVPILHTLIWSRFESMFMSLANWDMSDQSSTSLRMNYILTAFAKAWDRPLFGHGWASFEKMYGYSSLYDKNLYTHNNYAEVLFSFGLVGLTLYYWLPVRLLKRTVDSKNRKNKMLCLMYILVLLFIDIGTVSCYSSILGFLGFGIVNLLLENDKTQDEKIVLIWFNKIQSIITIIVTKVVTIMKLVQLWLNGVDIEGTLQSNIDISSRISNIDCNMKIGKVNINPDVKISAYPKSKLYIGKNVTIDRNVNIVCRHNIKIENNTVIGPNVCIYDYDYTLSNKDVESIVIGNNCYIGAGSVILKGTYIGENSVVKAGTILSGEYEPNSIIYNNNKIIVKENTVLRPKLRRRCKEEG